MARTRTAVFMAIIFVVTLVLFINYQSRPKPKNWLTGEVSLKGGQLTHPIQARQYAEQLGLRFVNNESERDELVEAGFLVPLAGAYIELAGVSQPYVLPITLQFVTRLSQQYAAQGCGKLIITSALRLIRDQPVNASPNSVHPTGMAVDFRVPRKPACNTWLRNTLLVIEADQRVDSTKEAGPPHLHAVVVTESYRAFLKERPIDVEDPELNALTLALYYEGAIAEPKEGLEAIAAVIRNRVRSKDFPNTILEVTAQGAAGRTNGGCQFSYMCDGQLESIEVLCRLHPKDMAKYWGPSWWDKLWKDKRTPCERRWDQMHEYAEDFINDTDDPTAGAVLYYAGRKPYWATGGNSGHGDMVPDSIRRIGNHTFGQSRWLGRDIRER